MTDKLENIYNLWNDDATKHTVIVASSAGMVAEIAVFCYGEKSVVAKAHVNSVDSIYKAADIFRAANITQGYMSEDGKPVRYKSRKEIIDDILDDVEPQFSLTKILIRIFS